MWGIVFISIFFMEVIVDFFWQTNSKRIGVMYGNKNINNLIHSTLITVKWTGQVNICHTQCLLANCCKRIEMMNMVESFSSNNTLIIALFHRFFFPQTNTFPKNFFEIAKTKCFGLFKSYNAHTFMWEKTISSSQKREYLFHLREFHPRLCDCAVLLLLWLFGISTLIPLSQPDKGIVVERSPSANTVWSTDNVRELRCMNRDFCDT